MTKSRLNKQFFDLEMIYYSYSFMNIINDKVIHHTLYEFERQGSHLMHQIGRYLPNKPNQDRLPPGTTITSSSSATTSSPAAAVTA